MTNKRITELTALDGDDVADNDVLAIVDVSDTTMAASGTTKKITVAELVTDSALTNKFWPNSTTALTGANLANGDKLAVVDVGSPDVPKYITADELAQGSQFSSRYKPLADDQFFVSATQMVIVAGASLSNSASMAPVLLFDQSDTEFVACGFVCPPSWASFHVDLFWTNGGAGAGNVNWRIAWSSSADGDTPAETFLGAFDIAAPAAGVLKVSRLSGVNGLTSTVGKMFNIQLRRTGGAAGDTLANDAAAYGVAIVRRS
jgi:hypothetical protein